MDVSDDRYTWCIYRLLGEGVDPDEVTASFRIIPSKVFKAGEPRGATGRIWPYSFWSLSSEGHVVSDDIAVHVDWILTQLEAAGPVVWDYAKRSEVEAYLSCLATIEGNGGIEFSPQLLTRITTLKVPLGVEIRYINPSYED